MLQLSFLNDNRFEQIKHFDEQGNECWFARELMPEMEYSDWRNFHKVIKKAKTACGKSGNSITSNFVEVNTNVDVGFGAREVADYKLSRFACYLIAMNGDSSKQVIADAQTYFAAQTRRQELSDEAKQLKAAQDVIEYRLKGYSPERALARVESKKAQTDLNKELYKTHIENAPDYGRAGSVQNQELFDRTKQEIVNYLGLLPSQEKSYRDRLGYYALEALRISGQTAKSRMKNLKRPLTTDEQLKIIRDTCRMIAPTMQDLAQYAGEDFVSGAPLDNDGNPQLPRNIRLLPKGE